jgi:hypothetical protein
VRRDAHDVGAQALRTDSRRAGNQQ